MAVTRYLIEMDFARAKRQADRLERIAKDIDNLVDDQLYGCLRQLSSNWKGGSAEAFRRKGEKAAGNMKDSAGKIKQAASMIREIAQNTYNAEMRAYELAQQRNYKL